MVEDVLGFCALILTMLMMIGIAVWFCCSIVESFIKMRRRLKKPRYNAFFAENKRLKSFLADAAKEDFRLRKINHTEVVRRKSNSVSRNVG